MAAGGGRVCGKGARTFDLIIKLMVAVIVLSFFAVVVTLTTSGVLDWGKLLGDNAAVTAMLDRLLHHAHVLKCGPRSWRTKIKTDLRTEAALK